MVKLRVETPPLTGRPSPNLVNRRGIQGIPGWRTNEFSASPTTLSGTLSADELTIGAVVKLRLLDMIDEFRIAQLYYLTLGLQQNMQTSLLSNILLDRIVCSDRVQW